MVGNIFAEIIVDNRSRNTDMCYTYLVPDEYKSEIQIGMRVLVPFGRGDRLLEGVVVYLKENSDLDISKLKYVDSIIDVKPIISKEMLDLAIWMKEKYLAQYIDVFRTVMPSGITNKVKKYLKLTEKGTVNKLHLEQMENEKRIMDYLKEKGDSHVKEVRNKLDLRNIHKHVTYLEGNGYITTYDRIESNVNKKYQKVVFRNFDEDDTSNIVESMSNRAHKQKEVLEYISGLDQIVLSKLLKEMSTTRGTVNALEKKGYIKIVDEEIRRNPISKEIAKYHKITLTPQQKNCVDTIYDYSSNNINNKFLIHGITGSGKTEVYLQLIEKMLKDKKQSIVLVPEISLTPQTVERFVGRFGDRVAILHSRLSLGERFDEWQKIKNEEVDIVVGARSAVFAPFSRLGLIIIDEEHENSYKSSMNPKYNTIEVAEKRCEIENASLLLGSATPSVETYYRAIQGDIHLLTLSNRANNKELPPIEVVDMKDELDRGNKSIFSISLYKSIKENLARKKQTILFLNRRGFSSFVSCRKCGYVVKCKHCDISLTYHSSKHLLICHYCGLSIKPPTVCPDCGSKYIKYFGVGTQKVEELVRKNFPEARVARMDVDTTSRKGSHEKILDGVKEGKVDILIGTQMISKGLDFPNVTLVGIIAADMSLNLPDFKASERTFQLITQVGGRAGRGAHEGKVILQTYEPDHYSIEAAREHDFISFYDKEILLRETFNYPPYSNIINITIIGKNEREVSIAAGKLSNDIMNKIRKTNIKFSKDNLMGPNPAPIAKIKSNYRWQVVIKSEDFEMDKIKGIIEEICLTDMNKVKYGNIRFSIDINPISII
ncbi:primosomal protein N' [Sporosalibacterium faouarense]|uniref:primosomal protein N' n=1 Tax=Sporosalibacterium faouarense TaxID=516123 RepID=UPI00141D5379|nr:primosomal protein N' [Sporosalibacterium faouarense]MTI47728.1 primosomal protein N' [Bacillota bacterium]